MPLVSKNSEKRYTYGDYLTWPEGECWTILDGVPYLMTPAPSRRHQDYSREFGLQIGNFLKGKPCRMYNAPFDVRFPAYPDQPDNEITNVTQPDLLVVCDRAKLDDRGCRGAPDWIIEILSPSTSLLDLNDKYALYEKSGVAEYWVVDPANQVVTVYLLENGKYQRGGVYGKDDSVAARLFDDLKINLAEVFVED
jgi:Uma2 family endonuclease